MDTTTKADPETVALADAKERFKKAVEKTRADHGRAPGDPLPEGEQAEAEAAPAAEEKKTEAKAKPKKAAKPKAPEAPKADPAIAALQAQVADLAAKLQAKQSEPEAEEDPVEALKDRLVARFGEDEAGDLMEAFDSTTRPLREQLKELRAFLKQATETGRANIARANQKRLAKEYPQLSSDSAWKIVSAAVAAGFQENAKRWDSPEDAYDDVARSLYGEAEDDEPEADEENEASEEEQAAAAAIASAALTPPGRVKKENRSRSDREREHFEFMKKNPHDRIGALKLARELGLRK